MIYSIGYQRLTVPQLRLVHSRLGGAKILDARSKPVSRKKGWSGAALLSEFGGEVYELHTALGGQQDRVAPADIEELAFRARGSQDLILLCLEEAPGECHRHHMIAQPLLAHGVEVQHIFQDELIGAGELQRSMDDDDDYTCEDCTLLAP